LAHTSVNTTISTLGDVMDFIAPFAGGTVPAETDDEYAVWISWIQNKQEEYARRAFWRRCLTRETIELTLDDETVVLPDRFYKPNGLFMLIVTDDFDSTKTVDWNEAGNSDGQTIFVEMINDPDSSDFGLWQMRFDDAVEYTNTAVIWYFSQPPVPNALTDKILLPGDMIGFAALAEYYRQANQEGSQDKAEQDAENRFQEYLALEVIPDKSELLTNSENQVTRVDRLLKAKAYYTSRPNRNYQS